MRPYTQHTCSVRPEGLEACRQTELAELERGEVSRSRSRKSPDAILSALVFKFNVGTGGTLAGGGAGAGGPGGVGVPGGIAGSTRGQKVSERERESERERKRERQRERQQASERERESVCVCV